MIVLPTFFLTELCDETDDGALKVTIPESPNTKAKTYYRRKVKNDNGSSCCIRLHEYNFFPVVVSSNGAPWPEANLYILRKLESLVKPSMSTLQLVAADLTDYKSFVDNEGIEPFVFPKRKLLRPTYRYRNSSIIKAQAGEVSLNTIKRRVASVISFYNWVQKESIEQLENPPWTEKTVYMPINSTYGSSLIRKVRSTDLSIKSVENKNPYSERILDGSELKPLTPDEQLILFKTLNDLCNPEMTLVHLIAFYTGARIQTVLTLRISIFHKTVSHTTKEVRVKVGPGTGVDTKNDKLMTLFIPTQLFEKIQTYVSCSRACKRRTLAIADHSDYLFLTNRGAPYYDAKSQLSVFDEHNTKKRPNNGQGVRQFISKSLIPQIRKIHGFENFTFKFHDLRATYGLNLTDNQLELVRKGNSNLFKAREFVRARMGHASASTTDLYLQYRDNVSLIRQSQLSYEEYIQALAQKTLGALHDIC